MSIDSRPAFSASVLGTISSESANASIASCSLPPTFVAKLRRTFAISASVAPPPATILLSLTTSATTDNASFMALSASSTIRSSPARTRIATDRGSLHFSTKIILSSPTLRSSTRPASPKSVLFMSSSLVMTFPPVARASFSISDCLTLRATKMPSFAKKC